MIGFRAAPAIGLLGLLGAAAALAPRSKEAADPCAPGGADRERGKAIFQRGEAQGKPVRATVDHGGSTISGRDAACAGCHGPSGLGREELGIPSLRPERLLGPRERAYDRAALARALAAGRTPEGRPLRPPMPRFALSEEATRDLFAYLTCLGHERDPGVSDDAVSVGAALPLSGPDASMGAAVEEALRAGLGDIGASGALRWRIDLHVEDTARHGAAGAARRLRERGILALLASAADDGESPSILPLTAPPPGLDPRTFHLFAAPASLAGAAVAHLSRSGGARLWVAHDGGPEGARWLEGARREAEGRGLLEPRSWVVSGGAEPPEEIRYLVPDAVLIAGEVNLPPSFRARWPAARIYALPRAASSLRASGDRLFVLQRGLPPPEQARALEDLSALLRRRGAALRTPALQAHAVVAARLLAEGLRRAGSPPTREALIAALEELRDHPTGLSPPVRFSRSQHVGVTGALVIGSRGAEWVEASP